MSRPFRFKQFTIEQSRAPMKVGTDGVLLGAWAGTTAPKRILDIGTGTGLIALMLAQRFPEAAITAIEPNRDAHSDARLNFEKSPFAERLSLMHTNLEDFQSENAFDLIVSNPPFFINSLVSDDRGKTEARHSHSLGPIGLTNATAMLSEQGKMSVIYPVESYQNFYKTMKSLGFHAVRKTEVKPTPDKAFHRVLGEFGRDDSNTIENKLVIEKYGRHKYSEEYVELTKNFYLFNEKQPRNN